MMHEQYDIPIKPGKNAAKWFPTRIGFEEAKKICKRIVGELVIATKSQTWKHTVNWPTFNQRKKMKLDNRSILFLVVDSCRYDTFIEADLPNLRKLGTIHRAQAPSYFTFASHAAMFVGFTPGLAEVRKPLINPKCGKIFKIHGAGWPTKGGEGFVLQGRSIMEGFKRLGYAVLGTGAVGWFDTRTPTGKVLTSDFKEFFYPGSPSALPRQLAWVSDRLAAHAGKPVFLFINTGETHVPYYYEDAPWSSSDNPCVPFQEIDRRDECRFRQRACLEYIDRQLGSLLDYFADASIVVCSDHGDCWGEDGLWEHGISHEMTLTVPLIVRLANGQK
jgi:hypothetical protein